jgi:hypothetical protein
MSSPHVFLSSVLLGKGGFRFSSHFFIFPFVECTGALRLFFFQPDTDSFSSSSSEDSFREELNKMLSMEEEKIYKFGIVYLRFDMSNRRYFFQNWWYGECQFVCGGWKP